MKPVLGITMGDGAGVGPEIIVKALTDKKIYVLLDEVQKYIANILNLAHFLMY